MERKLTIREMCECFEVTARALRFYEDKELLFPKRIGQRRYYGRREIGRLKLILRGKNLGFALEDMRQLLELYDLSDGQETQFLQTFEIAKNHLEQLKAKRAELDCAIEELQDQMAWGIQVIAALDASKHQPPQTR